MSNIKFISDKDNKKTITLSDLSKSKQIEMKRGKVIAKTDGKYPVYSSSVKNNGLMCYSNDYMFDEELISWSIDGGGDFFYRPKHKYSLTNVSGYIRIKDKNIDYKYLYSILSFLHQKYHFDYTTKAHPSVISKLYHIPLPKIEIQQKIGNLLFFIDKKLNYELYIIQNLKDIKKAMLEKMFPKENSNIPELRFKGFTETWEQRKLGEVAKFKQGVQVDLDLQCTEKTENTERFIRIVDYTQATHDLRFVNKDVTDDRVDKNDIVMVRYGATAGYVGRGIKGIIANNMFTVNPNDSVEKDFLYTFLKMEKIYTELNTSNGSSAMPALNFGMVGSLEIVYPSNAEQVKIGNYFEHLDNLITLHQYMYNKLFQVKNNIFPDYSAYYSNILHNFLPFIFTYTQPQYKSHTKKIY